MSMASTATARGTGGIAGYAQAPSAGTMSEVRNSADQTQRLADRLGSINETLTRILGGLHGGENAVAKNIDMGQNRPTGPALVDLASGLVVSHARMDSIETLIRRLES